MPGVLAMTPLGGGGLDRGWRRVAGGSCFLLFGLLALAVGLGVAPLLRLFSANRGVSQRRVRRVVRLSCRGFLALLRGLGLIDYRLIHPERLARPGRLLLANHPSLIDALFLLAHTPNAGCIVKGRLARHPVTRHVVQSAGFIANRNPRRVIAEACRALENGQSLIVFPEGTRSTPGMPIRLRRGGAIIALSSGAAITPVGIRCEPSTLIKGDPWYRVAPRKPCFTLAIGEAMRPSEASTALQATRDLNRRLETYFTTFLMDEDFAHGDRSGT